VLHLVFERADEKNVLKRADITPIFLPERDAESPAKPFYIFPSLLMGC
jgi:hypothetical protein